MTILVLVTVPKNKAKNLAKIALKEKTCACVNIIDRVDSFFWWKGKIEEERESLLLFKTKSNKFSQLKKVIKKNHPYSVPEIIAFKIDKINKEYLDWLEQETNA